jgi:ribosomal protein L44E
MSLLSDSSISSHSSSEDEKEEEEKEEEEDEGIVYDDKKEAAAASASASAPISNTKTKTKKKTVNVFHCPSCDASFKRKTARDRHVNNYHNQSGIIYPCIYCSASYDNVAKLREHRRSHLPTSGFVLVEKAFKRTCKFFQKLHDEHVLTFEQAFQRDTMDMQHLLKYELAQGTHIRASIIYHAEFTRNIVDEEANNEQQCEACFRVPSHQLYNESQIAPMIRVSQQYIEQRSEDFQDSGSGWQLRQILCVDLEINPMRPLNGACGSNVVSVTYPKDLNKISRHNVRYSNDCFLKAIAHHFTQSKNTATFKKWIKTTSS